MLSKLKDVVVGLVKKVQEKITSPKCCQEPLELTEPVKVKVKTKRKPRNDRRK